MSKVNDMGKARNDGLLMALRIAREAEEAGESPAEEIERELLFRKASNVAGPFTQAELSHDTLAIKRHTIRTIKAVAIIIGAIAKALASVWDYSRRRRQKKWRNRNELFPY